VCACVQRTDEEREDIKRTSQLGEAFLMKDMANKDLREELNILQKNFLSSQIELEVRASELRDKAIAYAHLQEQLRDTELDKQDALTEAARMKEMLESANERVRQAQRSAEECNKDLHMSNNALTNTVTKQAKNIEDLRCILDRLSLHQSACRDNAVKMLAFATLRSRLPVAEQRKKLERSLHTIWRAHRLHEWSQAVKLERMTQLADDCEQLQVSFCDGDDDVCVIVSKIRLQTLYVCMCMYRCMYVPSAAFEE
jgi:hypothetical protein